MFLPTGMLLLISQMSTAFSLHFLDVVIEVNATLFLVLTTLLVNIKRLVLLEPHLARAKLKLFELNKIFVFLGPKKLS